MEKHHLVSKSNYFIKNSNFDLSIEEQRIVLVLASMVQPNDTDFQKYIIKISDFIELLGLKDQSKYTELPKITKNLMQKVFEINDEETGELLQVAWLSSVRYKKTAGEISLEFSPELKPYLLDLKGFYTQYRLSNILSMKSKYSPRFYELLKMNEYQKKGFVIKIEELRKLFKAEIIYPKYNDFKKYIILQTQKELELYSDIRFEFEEIKYIRKVESIKFFIFPNEPKGQRTNVTVPEVKTKKPRVTKKIKETQKFIENQEKEQQKVIEKENQENPIWVKFLKKSKEEQELIENEVYKNYLNEIDSKDSKVHRGIFEKTKKTYIIGFLANSK